MKKTLWLAQGNSAQAWYRACLPANNLEQDWAGMTKGAPGKNGVMIAGSLTTKLPDLDKYEMFILQLAKGDEWVQWVKENKKLGKTILYEIDDFIHGIKNIKDHRFRGEFNKNAVKTYIDVMKECDGVICSTEFLADQYSKYNSNIYICHNGIETGLYENRKFEHKDDRVIIGWAGGTGHRQAIKSWFPAVYRTMKMFDNVHFISVGTNYADELSKLFPGRAISIPWTTIENYPFTLSPFDISLAPSHDSKYFKSKSDLRWLESAASSKPVIANPITYPDVVDGRTGIVASTEDEAFEAIVYLARNPEIREGIGDTAHDYVKKHRDISITKQEWAKVIS